jgi:hypothetical protein
MFGVLADAKPSVFTGWMTGLMWKSSETLDPWILSAFVYRCIPETLLCSCRRQAERLHGVDDGAAVEVVGDLDAVQLAQQIPGVP